MAAIAAVAAAANVVYFGAFASPGGSRAENTATPGPQASAAENARKAAENARKWGFYMRVPFAPAAAIDRVRDLKRFFPGSPIYLMSDGGLDFSELCRAEGCTFVLCPPANDKWHPWPFARRLYDAALSLKTEYVIMVEPDTTINEPIHHLPHHDAGSIDVPWVRGDWAPDLVKYIEELASERVPGFKWDARGRKTEFAGAAYFKTEAILDALSDEAVARLDWNRFTKATRHAFSSDIAMPILLAARGWDVQPWMEVAYMDTHRYVPATGAGNAVFRHFSKRVQGGRPKSRHTQEEARVDRLVYYRDRLANHTKHSPNCQLCYNLTRYVELWGSTNCTNHLPFEYTGELKSGTPRKS